MGVNGKSINSCLGDLFSVSWMEDSDAADLTGETLDAQFSVVKTKTSKSEVMQWGDLTFKSDMVSEFQSGPSSEQMNQQATEDPGRSAISARQVDLAQAYHNYAHATTSQERLAAGAELQQVLKDQLAVETVYEKFLEIVYPGDEAKKAAARESTASPNNRDCELATRESFISHGDFDSFSGFALGFHKYIVNVCAEVQVSGANIDLAQAAKQACAPSVVV